MKLAVDVRSVRPVRARDQSDEGGVVQNVAARC
jgi:hypothetical protein